MSSTVSLVVTSEYRGAKSGYQADNVTGKPVKTPPEPQDRQRHSSKLDVQVRDIHVDGAKWATDAGGLSTKFGKGGPGDSRGTSGKSNLSDDGDGNIKRPVHPAGKKDADTESMSR